MTTRMAVGVPGPTTIVYSPSIGGDRRIFVGAGLFVFLNVVTAVYEKIESAVLEEQPPIHPFIRSFLKSISLTVFLLKLAADVSWSDIYSYATQSGSSDPSYPYISLNQSDNNNDEEGDGDGDDEEQETDDGFDEVEHFSQDASWIPTSKPGEFSDSGSERGSIDGSIDLNMKTLRNKTVQTTSSSPKKKKRSKVRFSQFSEVRTLSSHEAHEAMFSRLSYQASIRAEAEAIKIANRIKPWQTSILALKLSVCSFAYQFFRHFLTFTTGLDFTPVIATIACLSCLAMILIFTRVTPSANTSSSTSITGMTSRTDFLRWNILVTVAFSLLSLFLICTPLTSIPSLYHLQYMNLEFLEYLVASASLVLFVVILRREVADVDLLDIPLFLGLLGFIQSLLFWPGFFFIPNLKMVFSDSLAAMTAVLLGDILFLALIDLLWIWSTLTTSSPITMVAYMLRVPLRVIISGSWEEEAGVFWLGFLGLFLCLGFLVVFTNWSLIESHTKYSFWSSSSRRLGRAKNEEKECLTLSQES